MKTHFDWQNSRKLMLGAMAALMLATPGLPAFAASEAENEALADLVSTLFRSGRLVISDNQDLINDPAKGDKGLSADKVVAAAKDNYKKLASKALAAPVAGSLSEQAVNAMFASMSEVMTKNQALINEKDKAFKNFIPAVFARQTAETFTAKMKGVITVKLTAPKILVRNRSNRPDEWEHTVIEQQFKKPGYAKGKQVAEMAPYNGKTAYRYMVPEYYGPSCLSCHGDPKGERDITGGLKEGGKLGDLGGAVSVIIH